MHIQSNKKKYNKTISKKNSQPQDNHRIILFIMHSLLNEIKTKRKQKLQKSRKTQSYHAKARKKDASKMKYREALTFGGSNFNEYEEEAFLENFVSGDCGHTEIERKREKKRAHLKQQ